MEENRLDILIPSAEHIAELKERGIDIELELARVVCDNLMRENFWNFLRFVHICGSAWQIGTVSLPTPFALCPLKPHQPTSLAAVIFTRLPTILDSLAIF